MEKTFAYIDGACSDNPGVGGWGAILIKGTNAIFISGSSKSTTNNKMELTSAIQLIKSLDKETNITIYTDSQYLKNGITTWIHNWKKNNWKTSNKKPVKNIDMWKTIIKISEKHKITWKWIKAHAGNIGNEIADSLATKAKKAQN